MRDPCIIKKRVESKCDVIITNDMKRAMEAEVGGEKRIKNQQGRIVMTPINWAPDGKLMLRTILYVHSVYATASSVLTKGKD